MTTDTATAQALRALCLPSSPPGSIRHAPFSMPWEGSVWTCATDGHGLLLVPGAHAPASDEHGERAAQMVRDVRAAVRAKTTVSRARVDAFLVGTFAERNVPCASCGATDDGPSCQRCYGSGETKNGSYCRLCRGSGHFSECGVCRGFLELVPYKLGELPGGIFVDRNIFRRFIGPMLGDCGDIVLGTAGALDAVTIDPNAPWFALVMPFRRDNEAEEAVAL